jgi:hypothetical protein
MADNTEFRLNLIRQWRAALESVRKAGGATITVGVTDMSIILDAADPDGAA